MPVSFYAQISIILLSLLVVVLPFLGLPQSWDKALTAVFGVLIFGIAVHALYRGYVRILKREERRQREKKERMQNEERTVIQSEEKVELDITEDRNSGFKSHDYSVLQIIRD